MSVLKPLKPEELPEEFRNRISWDRGTWVQQRLSSTGKSHGRTMVWVSCNLCGRENDVPVNDIRNWCSGRRKGPFPGNHRGCTYEGRIVTQQGYVWIYKKDHPKAYDGKYVPEHILVMEENLGRYLDRENETVHHKDGNKANNELSNLQLRKKYHGKGQVVTCADCGSSNFAYRDL